MHKLAWNQTFASILVFNTLILCPHLHITLCHPLFIRCMKSESRPVRAFDKRVESWGELWIIVLVPAGTRCNLWRYCLYVRYANMNSTEDSRTMYDIVCGWILKRPWWCHDEHMMRLNTLDAQSCRLARRCVNAWVNVRCIQIVTTCYGTKNKVNLYISWFFNCQLSSADAWQCITSASQEIHTMMCA